ncbi:hypothetical protein LSH36_418g02081 [Paralvinella palmiformis]|uniref:Cupin-like domain-containing protein n=1 Tax=Paralvinella palmiformis TaxID=53620 RepID=A0AAD9JC28_9ANNE|nr:hypothetical protein LSH36_418g02081 [Paralvinella palmiformis]
MSDANKMEPSECDVAEKFAKISEKAESFGLTGEHLSCLESVKALQPKKRSWHHCVWKTAVVLARWKSWTREHSVQLSAVFVLLFAIFLAITTADWPISKRSIVEGWYRWYRIDIEKEPCLIESGEGLVDYTRPPVDCHICIGIKQVDRVLNIRPEEFEAKYAYSGHPVVITDGTKSWSAIDEFSFEFFKSIYPKDSPALMNIEQTCQFFPYKTSFQTLGEVFNMSSDRAQMKGGSQPWYIGWSNCDPSAANILRQHYSRPYFLPPVAESSRTDWIFMGSPGYGAHMHIDNVINPSWQAQITGSKKWILQPPPECYLKCEPQIEVTVNPGEIIVIDTNRWYHSTLVVSDDMSITIGSEYD